MSRYESTENVDDLREAVTDDLPARIWPGSYAISYLWESGGEMCAICANLKVRADADWLIMARAAGDIDDVRDGTADEKLIGWCAYGVTCDYPEDGPVLCDECGNLICDPLT